MLKKYFVVFIMIFCVFVGSSYLTSYININKEEEIKTETTIKEKKETKEKKEDLSIPKEDKYKGINKLMIVAHPDDETFWGGAHLIEDNYLVVCITCGTVKRRVEEFKKAMSITGDKYIMLGYPDLTNGKKDDWSKVHVNIKSDLEKIINYKHWEMIVTHNPYGEYGHIHHIMTNRMVTELSDEDVLYYFGYYFFERGIKSIEGMNTISSESRKIKMEQIVPIYASQIGAKKAFDHMFDYENFVFNKDWDPKF